MTAEYIARYDKAVTDFSGEWELALEMSQFGFLKPPRRRVDRMTQTASSLMVETRQIDTRGDNTVTRVIPLDGREATADVLGRASRYRGTWHGAALIVEGEWEHAGQPRGSVETWSRDGERLVIERVLRMPGGDVAQRLILRRVNPTSGGPVASK